MLVPRRPDAALVVVHLRHFDEAPLRLVQPTLVGVLEVGDADQLAVGGEAPSVIGATEHRRVALVITADFHPAVGA